VPVESSEQHIVNIACGLSELVSVYALTGLEVDLAVSVQLNPHAVESNCELLFERTLDTLAFFALDEELKGGWLMTDLLEVHLGLIQLFVFRIPLVELRRQGLADEREKGAFDAQVLRLGRDVHA